MNVLNDYTRVNTQLIENLILPAVDDSKLNIVRAGNGSSAYNTYNVNLYNEYTPASPSTWSFNADGSWTTYCDLDTLLKGTLQNPYPGIGTYIIQIRHRNALYSGIFTYNPQDTIEIEDEILLHCSGRYTSIGDITFERLYARTAVEDGHYILQLALKVTDSKGLTIKSTDDNTGLIIKFRKLL